MKRLKNILAVLLTFCIVIGLNGCMSIAYTLLDSKAIAEAEAIPKIAFGTVPVSEDSKEDVFTVDQVLEAESEVDDYRSSHHYSLLTNAEQTVYEALEYALERGYTYIYVDDLILSNEEAESFGKILEYLALDSPLLEQNLTYSTGTFVTYYEITKHSSAKLDGSYINVENFSKEIWEKKKEALQKAKEITDNMPKDLDEVGRAKYLYDYTLDNVDYFDYKEDDSINDYLYDGLVGGKTHCDGTANMYSLLLRLAGIENFEKVYSGEGEDEIGHTWNMAKLNGEWYNIDATAMLQDEKEDAELKKKRNFAVEDRLQNYAPEYADIYPKADKSIGISFISMSQVQKLTLAKDCADMIRKNGYAAVLFDEYDESAFEGAMQNLADRLRRTVTWYECNVVANRKLILMK